MRRFINLVFLLCIIALIGTCEGKDPYYVEKDSDPEGGSNNGMECNEDTANNTAFMTDFATIFLNVNDQVAYSYHGYSSETITVDGAAGGKCVADIENKSTIDPYTLTITYDFQDYNDTGTVYIGAIEKADYFYGYNCDKCGVDSCSHCVSITGTVRGSGQYSGAIEYHLMGIDTMLAGSGYYIVNCQRIEY